MKKFLMMAALLVATLTVSAQDYNWAIGLRGGGANGGLTIKNNMGANAWELGIDLGWDNSGRVQGLYMWQTPVITDGFNLYYGAGAYLGGYHIVDHYKFGIGAELVLGLEYKIPNVPIALSLDYRPSISVLPDFGFGYYDVGFGVKYCF